MKAPLMCHWKCQDKTKLGKIEAEDGRKQSNSFYHLTVISTKRHIEVTCAVLNYLLDCPQSNYCF